MIGKEIIEHGECQLLMMRVIHISIPLNYALDTQSPEGQVCRDAYQQEII